MFFSQLTAKKNATAVIDGELSLTYLELFNWCESFSAELKQVGNHARPLVFLNAYNNHLTLIAYLSCLKLKFPVLLLDPELSEDKFLRLQQTYQPNLLIENLHVTPLDGTSIPLAPELALLLSTSGSTGSAKQVCLSAINLQANAESICQYLPLQSADKTITTLPFFYSYGLSVINSHLHAGACIVFNQYSIVSREFWDCFKQHQISSFAGVPYTYEMLLRLRFDRMSLPSLRYFTQAGGKLKPDFVSRLAEYAEKSATSFFIMYGQTEATARMAFLAPQKVKLKPSAIGQSIPNGHLILLDDAGAKIENSQQVGELVYQGENVMLGYAEGQQDLACFQTDSRLFTGDLAYFDADGDFFIKGRKKRFIKLFGQRINLDEVEQLLMQKELESYCVGDDTKLIVAVRNINDIKVLRLNISQMLGLHPSVIQVMSVSELPITTNGKKDYQQILQLVGE